jgi:NADH-quinone oxidoreductase subunit A
LVRLKGLGGMAYMAEIIGVLVYTVIVVGMGVTILVLIKAITGFLGTAQDAKNKYDVYECGVPVLGSARDRFGVKFYLIALMFVLFDIETVFLIPYAVAFREVGAQGFWAFVIFMLILCWGLWYEYLRGSLEWEEEHA